MLAEHGAVIVDADVFAREAVRAGNRGVRRGASGGSATRSWGPTGELDRAALASIVFADRAALDDLEAIVHPEVRRMVADRHAGASSTPTTWSCS